MLTIILIIKIVAVLRHKVLPIVSPGEKRQKAQQELIFHSVNSLFTLKSIYLSYHGNNIYQTEVQKNS